MSKFVHLHTHSHYSLLDGLSKIDSLVLRAKELGMEALAITDHGNLYGAVEFYKKAKAVGIKPIIGVETYVAKHSRLSKDPRIDTERYHLTLLAKDKEGYQNLVQLITKSHLEGFYYKPRIDKELLEQHRQGLICLSGCFSGEVGKLLRKGRPQEAEEIVKYYHNLFGEDYYLEIQPHNPDLHPDLIAFSLKFNIPLAATQDSHYLTRDDAPIHDVLLAIQTNNRVDEEDRLTFKDHDCSFRSGEEMAELFKDLPEAIENTVKIAEKCNFEFELGKVILPKYSLPEGEGSDSLLQKLAEEGVKERYEKITPEIKARFDHELDIIKKTGLADYFLIVQDLVNWAKNHGIVVGPGRGSSGGSLVSYALRVTDVDPIKYDLLFERFLNPERNEMPDIDIDFADLRRDEVVGYLRDKYGENHVARIITFGTMAARAAVRDAGRAMGLSYSFCDQIAKLIPFVANLGKETIPQYIEKSPDLKTLYRTDPQVKELLDVATSLEGVARHASVHACGTVITKEPLTNYLPLQRAPQDDDMIITQYEMHAIEDLGLLKIDLLGLRNLTIIEETLRLVRELRGEEIKISEIPLDDEKTYKFLQTAETTGVFQFECLSGDTIVSNTTIKKLCEKKDRKTLNSVYLDEGKVHKNKILNVVRSGVKDVYVLIAENGWHIKATKDHYLMTDRGWKKLGDIQPGDHILMKTKARHLIYNECRKCGKQISGQKDGKSRFCYRCSARHYKNPSKEISRRSMKAARTNFFTNGGATWNKGATVQNDERWARTAKKISRALIGRSLEERMGEEIARAVKVKLSKRFSGSGNPMFGKPSPHRHGGIRKDLGHYVRSNWEADFARILKLHKTSYQYEPKTFPLTKTDGTVVHYTPDFYVPATNTFYEIKGWLHDADAEKINLFKEQYPEYNFVLINTTKFAELALQHRSLVTWECPRLPVKQGFGFVAVHKIRYAGKEETYDIVMEAPGNNFVANGFVVHNSSGMRRYMKDIKPTDLEDLIALVALYRPGPMELIPSFIKRKFGREKVAYLHPKLEPILQNTHGIGVYQEQMMRIATDLAGYSLPEADTLRKAIGKKIRSLLNAQQEKLINGMIKNGIDPKTAKRIWDLFPPFARYGFPRAHAVAYALIGYQTAYLKARYPVEFMTSLLNNSGAEVERVAFLANEAGRINIQVLPPNVNESNSYFAPENQNIRFGLSAIKNVGVSIAETIVEERFRSGPYLSLTDFAMRLRPHGLNKKVLESLIKAGALDSLGMERMTALENADLILRTIGGTKAPAPMHQSLFGANHKFEIQIRPAASPASKAERLGWEKELLGLYITEHPLKEYIANNPDHKALAIDKVLQEKREGIRVKICGVISKIQQVQAKNGSPMLFVKVEDLSNNIEILVFADILGKNPNLWQENNPIIVDGRISKRNGDTKLVCLEAEAISS